MIDNNNNDNNNENNNKNNNLRAYAMPPSYRRGSERVRGGRSWSEQAEANHVGGGCSELARASAGKSRRGQRSGSFVHVLRVLEALGGSFVCILRVREALGGSFVRI